MYSERSRRVSVPTPIGGWAAVLLAGARSLLASRSKTVRPALSLEERLPLGGNRAVMLVACDGHRYLLGGSADSLFLIGEVSPLEAQSEGAASFRETLAAASSAVEAAGNTEGAR
ncbi:flagellar biosynthetic protein FliO [Silvibacterium dinghuense]|uniref:Uncharacterized protein n=1 Tax=Silvibacterium dinghuense TaxID=1560006 RepID=A0A4Q1SEH0_9BACT|nr:flagellar biosynthetic protein FliO [Silvibacterium dinghuense]RXS95662.1 hypothetical protein ESZ00_14000 [Silvibacterium dinghuense]GGH14772.1 hypothetical protein GCM10011586_35420 [Silvibacterium dinghuense]